MPKTEKLVRRKDKVAFMDVGGDEIENFQRMRKFTEITTSKNAKEYNRQYVDEEVEDNDTIGYAEEKSYAFDEYTGNPVHEKIVNITDDELTGDDAVIKVLVVDLSKPVDSKGFKARLRKYAVVPSDEGGEVEAYTYSGALKAKGKFQKGTAVISEDGLTATFTAEEKVNLMNLKEKNEASAN